MATVALTEATFESTVTGDGIIFVDCWAEWCGPCRSFSPVFEAASEQHPEIVFGKVDTEAERGIAQMLSIQTIPTVMAFRDGIMVMRESGAFNKSQLEEIIEQVKQLDMDEVREQLDH
ncbi:MAG: thioredoxin family protein [Propionibacteriaceae bacterium]|jgi:thioredoxin 1|nr:thioredoxin family protein [Propionibacteriaceae bacterium]